MHRHCRSGRFVITAFVALLIQGVAAEALKLELASPFVNDAILQREMEVPVWGWAEPGRKISVEFAGQTKSGTADQKGKWMIKLDPLLASAGEQDFVVKSATGEIITRTGVLVGEVWFSSGQSNMDWLAGKSKCRELAQELASAEIEIPIREYTVDTGSSLYPASRAASEAGWKSSKSAGNFSALSLAFAADLYHELQVPIGIIRSTHGATPIETWIAYEGLAAHPKLQDIALRVRQSNPSTPDGKTAFVNYYQDLQNWQIESAKLINRGGKALPRPPLPGIADDWKGATRMYQKKIAPLVPYAIRGAIWCQGTSNADDGKIYAAKMEALVNGWRQNWNHPDLPFIFTQMQCYGEPDPNNVGFADIREAQTLFFLNAKNVGMVPQYDLNSERPTGIHYYNKLDPGKRMARWALAHSYGRKDLAYTGPIYQSHAIEGNKVRVQFEQRGPGGSLMVGSKGMQADLKNDPKAYVEPARETPGEPLQHFRLAGKDRVWHPAEAVIKDNEVIVTSQAVPSPVGVQYAYSASPIGANLYNRAGLPALPFAFFEGPQMFNEDHPNFLLEEEARKKRYLRQPSLQPMTLLRNHAVLQRDQPVPIWGHGVPGTEITVTFGELKETTTVNEFERWEVQLDPQPASGEGRDLLISASDGQSRTVQDVLIGDVWFLTGSRQLDRDLIRPAKGEESPAALPLVREFRIKTNARRFRTPRTIRMEIGSGKYEASWQAADFDGEGDPPSVAAYHFAAKAQEPGVPVGIVTLGADNPPLTWVSPKGMQTAKGFEKERDALNLGDPSTDICKKAVQDYIETLKKYGLQMDSLLQLGVEIPEDLMDAVPPFPQPFYDEWASRTETATHTYNFCLSANSPFALRGMIWIPAQENISDDVSRYAPALEVFASGLPQSFGQSHVPFLYAQPGHDLVEGIGTPKIKNAIGFNEWPKTLEKIAATLGSRAKELK